MITLGIDTSNKTMGISLYQDRNLMAEYVSTNKKNHSVTLMPAIDFLMQENQLKPSDIDEILVASGPGSYTGLRIAVTTAKTLAWTLKADLYSLSSLAIIAAGAPQQFSGLIVPLINARRDNVYTGIYQWQNGEIRVVKPDGHLSIYELFTQLKEQNDEILFIGEDVPVFESMIATEMPQANYIADSILPRTMQLVKNIGEKVSSIDEFTPQYLKLVEAEENWLKTHKSEGKSYVERV